MNNYGNDINTTMMLTTYCIIASFHRLYPNQR